MEINYTTLWFQIDSPENRVAFWQCNEHNLPAEMRDKMNLSVVPRFLVYAGGSLCKEIQGAKFVDIEAAINDNLPELDD